MTLRDIVRMGKTHPRLPVTDQLVESWRLFWLKRKGQVSTRRLDSRKYPDGYAYSEQE